VYDSTIDGSENPSLLRSTSYNIVVVFVVVVVGVYHVYRGCICVFTIVMLLFNNLVMVVFMLDLVVVLVVWFSFVVQT